MVQVGVLGVAALASRNQYAAARTYSGRYVVGGVNAIGRGLSRSFDDLDPVMRTLAQSLATGALPARELRETNQEIARRAQMAMVTGYRYTLPERSGGYRPGDRLTGQLAAAMASPAMIERTSDRVISFVNQSHLDSTAKHWYRVNYGVAGATTQGPSREAATFTVNVRGRTVMVLRDRGKPRPGGVFLPRVFTWAGREMVVLRGPGRPARPGRGARAAHFVDLGLGAIAKDAGPAYERLLRWYVTQKRSQAKMARREIFVPDLRVYRNGAWSVTVT